MSGADLKRRRQSADNGTMNARRTTEGDGTMWSAPMPLENLAGLRIGYVKTDGDRIALSACGAPYGPSATTTEGAAINALGAMPPILTNDWADGIARTLRRHGYALNHGAISVCGA